MAGDMTLALPAGRGVPLRPLVVLAGAVLAVHLLLLQARPGTLSLSSPWRTQPLITRVIEATPPTPQVAVPTPTPLPAEAPAPAAPPAAQAEPAPPTPAAQTPAAAVPPPVPAAPPQAAAPPAPPAGPTLTVSSAFQVPSSIVARYAAKGEANRLPYMASAFLAWSHDGNQYEARLKINAPGAREQVSTGRLTADGLAPTRFGDLSRTEQAAHFVRDKGIISFSNNAPDAALQAGAQDRLSVLLQLGALLAADPARYPAGTRIDVQTAGVRDADTWTFTIEGKEELQISNRARATIKLERLPQHEFDEKVELWVAPDMDYLPVRVRLTQPGGDFVDLLWDGANQL